jgi:hypothetical protein
MLKYSDNGYFVLKFVMKYFLFFMITYNVFGVLAEAIRLRKFLLQVF